MTARWEEVLDKQLDLWRFFANDRRAEHVHEGYIGDVRRKYAYWREVDKLFLGLPDGLLFAEPVWIDPDLQTLVEHVAQRFEPEPLVAEDLFTASGFAYFPRPLYFEDVHSKRVCWRGVLWRPAAQLSENGEQQGLAMAFFSDANDPDDYNLSKADAALSNYPPGTLILAHLAFWPYNTGYDDSRGPGGFYEIARIVQTFWRVSSQTIASRAKQRGTSPFRARMKRAKYPEKYVTVIHLRKPERPPGHQPEHRDVEWSHRWYVDYHWRWQYYPSLGIRRQILIQPYIKGPEDKPLAMRGLRAFEVDH